VTPDGRATNLGAIAVDGGKGKLKTSYSGPQFALIVTAEPHFAVTAPSTAVALINVGNAKVKGTESKVTTLAERADYSKLEKIAIDPKTAPASLVGARYSVAIAAATGADKYAASAYEAAQQKLAAAEAAQASKKSADRKTAPTLAREATQAGEDARRAGMAGKAAADEEAKRAAAAAAAAEQAEAAGQVRAAEVAKEELRNRLSQVLPTRVTERGLVSELGGVQFATGTATLTTPAQVSLARFAGVVSSYPGLKFSVEGHSDNTGSAEKNQELSLRRAIAVRDNLIAQGIPASTLDVDGFGASRPVADNATAEGRAHNRRVEIVVSGGPLAK
jgi:outer membrane protein OmpA-like peptidoglycan-associated protein